MQSLASWTALKAEAWWTIDFNWHKVLSHFCFNLQDTNAYKMA